MDLATKNNERIFVDRRGQPAVVIMGVEDYLAHVSDAPDWLKSIRAEAKDKGLDKMTMEEIDAEIAEYRREKREAKLAAAK
jgi:PHD/YefM family antitoxin component YafN of YafNO toxin-antitoxin module